MPCFQKAHNWLQEELKKPTSNNLPNAINMAIASCLSPKSQTFGWSNLNVWYILFYICTFPLTMEWSPQDAMKAYLHTLQLVWISSSNFLFVIIHVYNILIIIHNLLFNQAWFRSVIDSAVQNPQLPRLYCWKLKLDWTQILRVYISFGSWKAG